MLNQDDTLSHYRNFDVIVDGEPGRYTVGAVTSDGGRTTPEAFPWTGTEATDHLLLRLASGSRVDADAMVALGTRLFGALFTRRIAKAHAAAQAELPNGQRLRLRLVVRPPEVAILPWELLYDPDEHTYLATLHSSPLTRYLETGRAFKPIRLKGPLRVLYASTSPLDMGRLELDKSLASLQTGLAELTDKGHLELTVLRHTTPDKLQHALRQGFHILHFDGHGGFDPANQNAYLVLEDDSGMAVRFPSELVAAFAESKGLRLIVLGACQTSSGHPADPLAGVAQQLILAGRLPAVVAMQFRLRDDIAIAFTRHFYGGLAASYPVEGAVAEGRKAIMGELRDLWRSRADWATPVLYMQTAEGRLWHLGAAEQTPPPAPAPPAVILRINPDNPPFAALRALMETAFRAEELRRFCQERVEFRPLLTQFGPGHGLDDMVDRVIDFCQIQLLWDELLGGIAEEYPRQYARFEPQLRGER